MTAVRVKGVLELHECWTQKLCAVLMRVLLGLFTQSQLSVQTLTVSVQPPCAIAYININEQVKTWQTSQILAAIPLFLGTGSVTLTASVALLR